MKHLRNLSRVYAAILIAMVLVAWSIGYALSIAHAQEVQQVSILDHPIDPDLLLVSTPDGRYPFQLLAGTDCSWVRSDTNVQLVSQESSLWEISDGADARCNIAVGDQVDPTPCTQVDGTCDVAGDHTWN